MNVGRECWTQPVICEANKQTQFSNWHTFKKNFVIMGRDTYCTKMAPGNMHYNKQQHYCVLLIYYDVNPNKYTSQSAFKDALAI